MKHHWKCNVYLLCNIISRQETYNFDRMLYVVGIGQSLHFENLKYVLSKLGCKFAEEQAVNDMHIRFGQVEGMKSRTGNIVLLQDIIDTAKVKMLENMKTKESEFGFLKFFFSVFHSVFV